MPFKFQFMYDGYISQWENCSGLGLVRVRFHSSTLVCEKRGKVGCQGRAAAVAG